jgi:hypothetical protein
LTVEALEDRTLPSLTLVSANAAGTDGGNNRSGGGLADASVNADGRFAAFTSFATDLVSGFVDDNGSLSQDVYVRDLQTGVTTLVSRSTAGATRGGNAESLHPVISADGRFVAFVSRATDLVPGFNVNGNGGGTNVYVCNLQTGVTTLISRSTAGAATGGNSSSDSPVISADGGVVAFSSTATDLVPGFVDGDGGVFADIYRRDLQTGVTALVSHSTASPTQGGNEPSSGLVMSTDGRFVAFDSGATDLVAGFIGGLENVFENDRGGPTTLISHSSAGLTRGGNGPSFVTSINDSGEFLVFQSEATDLDSTFVDNNGSGRDVFLSNTFAGIISLVSHNPSSPHSTGNNDSGDAVISADGRFVAFASIATDLIPGFVDNNGSGGPNFPSNSDVFLRDLFTGATTLVSHSTAGPTVGGNGGSSEPVVANGGVVAFQSVASDLASGVTDPNRAQAFNEDVFVRDPVSGITTALSTTPAGDHAGNRRSEFPVLSADGTRAVFFSEATDLVANDTTGSNLFAVARPGHLQFGAPAFSVAENSGSPALITVTRTGGADGTVSVTFRATGGTATPGADFLPVSGKLVFGPGEVRKTFNVFIVRDGLKEPPETVLLTLSNPTAGADLGSPATAVLIINDGIPSRFFDVTPQIQVSQRLRRSGTARGRARIKVTLTNSGEALHGPLALVLDGLPRKVKLLRAAGVTAQLPPLGSPLVQAGVDGLAPGQSLVFDLEFASPKGKRLRFVPRVIVGPGLP